MDEYEARDWLAFLYNRRGYKLEDHVWEKFKAWCEANGIDAFDPRFNQLPGGKET